MRLCGRSADSKSIPSELSRPPTLPLRLTPAKPPAYCVACTVKPFVLVTEEFSTIAPICAPTKPPACGLFLLPITTFSLNPFTELFEMTGL